MSLFSLDWFKSQRQKEMDSLKVEEQRLKNEILLRQIKSESSAKPNTSEKPYKIMKLVNNVLTVVMNDGNVIVRSGVTYDDFKKLLTSDTEKILLNNLTFPEKVKSSEKEAKMSKTEKIEREVVDSIAILGLSSQFVVEENSVMLKGISRTLPALLIVKFAEVVTRCGSDENLINDDEFLSLKRFFMWACLNPRAEVVDRLYDFLVENSFRITKQGMFVALRNVVSLSSEQDEKLVSAITNGYQKVKAVWKRKPSDYRLVVTSDWYNLEKESQVETSGTVVGNLQDLYINLPDMRENRFTDAYTRTFDIRIGKVVSMPPEKCSWSTADCAEEGLHFTSDEINYVGCGDTSVLVLINPMKVVGIGSRKGRCYEYLPIMAVPRDEATTILHDLDFDTLELDESYAVHELENLEEKTKEGFTAETKKYEFNLPTISTREIKSIINELNGIKSELKKRMVKIN